MKSLVLLVLSCTIMLSAIAQSPIVGNKISRNHYKNEFNGGFMSKTNTPQFDSKTKQKHKYQSLSTSTQKLDSMIHASWYDLANQWWNTSKDEYTYDANGNIIADIFIDWGGSGTIQCDTSNKHEYAYDANDNRTVDIYKEWNCMGHWDNVYKNEYTYDGNSNMTILINSHWNNITSLWEKWIKKEYTYDANFNKAIYINSIWNSTTNQWDYYDKTEYTYNVDGNMTVSTQHKWNSVTNQWENFRKIEYTYDTNSNRTVDISSYWNSTTSQWDNSIKIEYTFDSNNNIIVINYSSWNSTTSQWENLHKNEYTHDVNGNITVVYYYDWNSTTSQWKTNYKNEYTYNLAYLSKDLILPDDLYNFSVNEVTSYIHYSYYSTPLVSKFKQTYYYSDLTTSSSGVNKNNTYTVYPNPASEYVTFDIPEPIINSKIDIFTVQGTKILTQPLNNKTVDVSALSSGIYFYQLSVNGKIKNGKIVIK